MDYDSLKMKLGPCGISCEKCFAFTDGPIKKNSIELKNALGNFDVYAGRFTDLLNEPKFSKYGDFKIMLNYFSEAECRGCRLDGCKFFPGCKVSGCSREKNADFCFQCGSFPCENTGFDENLKKRWKAIQVRMKEVGVEDYYNEIKDKPRY